MKLFTSLVQWYRETPNEWWAQSERRSLDKPRLRRVQTAARNLRAVLQEGNVEPLKAPEWRAFLDRLAMLEREATALLGTPLEVGRPQENQRLEALVSAAYYALRDKAGSPPTNPEVEALVSAVHEAVEGSPVPSSGNLKRLIEDRCAGLRAADFLVAHWPGKPSENK